MSPKLLIFYITIAGHQKALLSDDYTGPDCQINLTIMNLSYVIIPDLPKAFTSLRLSASTPLSIWTMTYLPDTAWPEMVISYWFIFHSIFWPEMIMCCPSVAGPAKWPRSVPPENIWLPEVGTSSEMRTSTFRVRSPQQWRRLKISTLWMVTVVPKSMAIQGVGSSSVWQKSSLATSGNPSSGPSVFPSMHLAAP